jgi:hypothetical protein
MTNLYEVQFRDGFGAWRRWAVRSTVEAAEQSRAKCAAFLGDGTLVRVRLRGN